jgi:alpha-ketoglutarate-dependent 2,4-dichlorophenoxyacetate dioxygenase
MPHKEDSKISIVELHPTFAAEVYGVDFSDDVRGVSQEDFAEIYKAITKVSSREKVYLCFEP